MCSGTLLWLPLIREGRWGCPYQLTLLPSGQGPKAEHSVGNSLGIDTMSVMSQNGLNKGLLSECIVSVDGLVVGR